jgi:glycerophosphoryl diester phosphodiesterase
MIASWLVPTSIGSLPVLVARAGGMLLILALASAAINVLATITFAAIQFGCYRHFYPDWTTSVGRAQESLKVGNVPQRGRQRGRWAMAILFASVLVMFIGFQFLDSMALKDNTLVMAHRGSSFFAPENSLAAIQQAIVDGADWVEIDVQETVDGEVVVIHDSDLMKLSRNPVKIWNATLAELQEIDIGSWKSTEFSNERVATLGQVLEACRDRIGVMIELKYYGHDQKLEQRVIELVEQHDMANQVMIMSLKPEGIKKVRAIRPDWKCGVLFSVSIGQLEQIDADFLAVNAKFATRRFIERVHRSGRKIYAWTIDEPSMMSTLINRGVDGILTNQPETARQVLKSRAEMGISERMLTELASLLRVDRDQVLEDQ